jgi:hypothetical protein
VDGLAGGAGGGDANRASSRGAQPAAATSADNLVRKVLREQGGFTDSWRRDSGQRKKKRDGFRDVNQNFSIGRTDEESRDDHAHRLA